MVKITDKLKFLVNGKIKEFDSTLRFIYLLDRPLADLVQLLDLQEVHVARAIKHRNSLICKCLALHLRIRRRQAKLLALQQKHKEANQLLLKAKQLALRLDRENIFIEQPNFDQLAKVVNGQNSSNSQLWQANLDKLTTMFLEVSQEITKLVNRLKYFIIEVKKVTDLLQAPTTPSELRHGIKEAIINPNYNRMTKLSVDPNTEEVYYQTGPLAAIKVSPKTAMGEATGHDKQLRKEAERLVKMLYDILKEENE